MIALALVLIPICALMAVVDWFTGHQYQAAWNCGLMLICFVIAMRAPFRHD